MEQCLVCNRISPKYVAMFAHKIFGEKANKDTIHKIIIDACNAINYADNKKRIVLCGKPMVSILSGLFYWLGFRYNCRVSQWHIALCFERDPTTCSTEVTVRKSMRLWAKEFPELIKYELWLVYWEGEE